MNKLLYCFYVYYLQCSSVLAVWYYECKIEIKAYLLIYWFFTARHSAVSCTSCNISVCLSVTRRYCVKTNEDRMIPSSQLGNPLNLALVI